MTNRSTTEVADCYLGNSREDDALAAQVAQSRQRQRCLEVTIEQKDCLKGRIFTQSASGQAVGIIKGRDWQLRDGDVLRTQRDRLVLISLKKQQVLALRFDRESANSPAQLVNLGHIIGNHHWPMTLHAETLYIALSDNADTIEATIYEIVETLKIKGLRITREFMAADHTLDFSSAHSLAHPLPHTHDHTHAH
jgi:urease accessory protein